MKQNYNKYIQIKEQTYHIFEIYHHQALVNIFKSNVSAKDLALIKSIASFQDATPSKITSLTGLSRTNLSNRLAYLEEENLIVRSKNTTDQRSSSVSLTPKALVIIKEYKTYFNNFYNYVKKALSLNEKLLFNHFLTNWAKTKTKQGAKNKPVFNVLDDIESFFLNKEGDFFNNESFPFSFSELSFLSELYLNEVMVGRSLPKLAEYLFMPYQTLMSKVKRYTQEGYISKNKKKMAFTPVITQAIDQFIMMRIINYYEALLGAASKEIDVILKVFELLKTYASSFISK